MAKILFGHSSHAMYTCDENYVWGFNVTKSKVNFRIKNLCHSKSGAIFKSSLELPAETILAIEEKLLAAQETILNFPDEVGNHSIRDGSSNQFILLDKRIYSPNIGYTTKTDFKKYDFDDIEKQEAILQNALLDIVKSIYPLLKPFGFRVKSWSHFYCEWPPINDVADFLNDYRNQYLIPNIKQSDFIEIPPWMKK